MYVHIQYIHTIYIYIHYIINTDNSMYNYLIILYILLVYSVRGDGIILLVCILQSADFAATDHITIIPDITTRWHQRKFKQSNSMYSNFNICIAYMSLYNIAMTGHIGQAQSNSLRRI